MLISKPLVPFYSTLTSSVFNALFRTSFIALYRISHNFYYLRLFFLAPTECALVPSRAFLLISPHSSFYHLIPPHSRHNLNHFNNNLSHSVSFTIKFDSYYLIHWQTIVLSLRIQVIAREQHNTILEMCFNVFRSTKKYCF